MLWNAKTGDWYRNFEYDAERERGLDFSEDLFNPLVLRFDLDALRARLGRLPRRNSAMSRKSSEFRRGGDRSPPK